MIILTRVLQCFSTVTWSKPVPEMHRLKKYFYIFDTVASKLQTSDKSADGDVVLHTLMSLNVMQLSSRIFFCTPLTMATRMLVPPHCKNVKRNGQEEPVNEGAGSRSVSTVVPWIEARSATRALYCCAPSFCVFSGQMTQIQSYWRQLSGVIDARATLQTDLVRKSNPTVKLWC